MGPLKPVKKLESAALFTYALKALTARALSASELKAKLERRAMEPADIDAVLVKLREYGYVNDQQFAESFASARRENQGHGKLRVLRDLRQRKVAPKLAEQVVKQAYTEVDETEMIEQYLARKFRTKPLAELFKDEKKVASAYRRLRYAGFSPGNCRRVLMRYAHQPELLDSLESEDPGGSPEGPEA